MFMLNIISIQVKYFTNSQQNSFCEESLFAFTFAMSHILISFTFSSFMIYGSAVAK